MSSTDPIVEQPPPAIVAAERRPQADPLPSKRGEIGYVEGAHIAQVLQQEEIPSLPARHPADRDQPSQPDTQGSADVEAPPPTPAPAASDSSSDVASVAKPSSLLGLKAVSFGGLQSNTLIIFVLQLVVLAGTIVGWVFATKLLMHVSSQGGSMPGGQSSAVFIHVVFVFVVIAQLIYLERRIFRLRGERYSYLHPGEILPRHRNLAVSPQTIAFAPWNRPPLPTYAAALAQSGAGTGDVEDHLIAAAPPPAYGNTRGSTLLLAGYLRNSLRAQRPLSASSQATHNPGQTPTESRLSYVSRDEEREEIENADRARRLEETLSRLESPPQSSVARS